MVEVTFYDNLPQDKISVVVLLAQHHGQWVLCKHRNRDSFECSGGKRRPDETVAAAAARELWEETGALRYTLHPITAFSYHGSDGILCAAQEIFAYLSYAEITAFGTLPAYEMECISLHSVMPKNLTYPELTAQLLRFYQTVYIPKISNK